LNAEIERRPVFSGQSSEAMSTEKDATAGAVEEHGEKEELFSQLPSEVRGWFQYSREDDSLFEFWKKGSTHIVGRYEQMLAKEMNNGEIRLQIRVYDQFSHLINTRNLSEQPPERANHIWELAEERMNEFPSNQQFETPPELPAAINDWELITRKFERPLNITKWEQPFGRAELTVEQTNVEAHYSHTKRQHTVEYREPDTDTTQVVSDVPRTSAFEIGMNSLNALTAPLSKMGAVQKQLQKVKGIGPAKSKQFILLGITTRNQLMNHIDANSPLVNHHHTEAVEKLLTNTIRDDLRKNNIRSSF
jgi:predicted flap endonuclease-1-like 5' DNA nuclease